MEHTRRATTLAHNDVRRRPWRRIAVISVLAPLAAAGTLALSATGAEAAVPATGGELVSWGNGNQHSQGPGGVTDLPAAASPAVAMAGGVAHSLAVTPAGKVVAWGHDSGAGETVIPLGAQSGVTAVAAGDSVSYALKSDGSVLAWGRDDLGQTEVPAAAQSGVTAISAMDADVLALKSDGSVVQWGAIEGFGPDPSFPPVPSSLSSGVVSIAAGRTAALAVKADGTVVAWGTSSLGTSLDITQLPAGLSGVTKVAVGLNFAVALKSDGTVVAWGNNTNGTATVPAGLSGVTSIAAGEHYAMALKSDGSVVTWGYTNSDGAAPTPATLGSQVYTIAAGYYNGMAIRAVRPTISGNPTPAVVGKAYDYALTVGGSPTPTTQLVGGHLPAGLSLTSTGHIVGTPTQAARLQVTIFATSTAGSAGLNATITVNPAHSTNVEFLDQAPASVVDGALESDQYVRSFAEQYNKVLASNLTVGGSTIPAGTRVNVYYVHADHVGSQNLATKFTGSEWFGTKVLATATSTADLESTTALLGAPGTTYSTRDDQGLEFDDSATKWTDQTGVDFSLNSWNVSDAIRVITLAP